MRSCNTRLYPFLLSNFKETILAYYNPNAVSPANIAVYIWHWWVFAWLLFRAASYSATFRSGSKRCSAHLKHSAWVRLLSTVFHIPPLPYPLQCHHLPCDLHPVKDSHEQWPIVISGTQSLLLKVHRKDDLKSTIATGIKHKVAVEVTHVSWSSVPPVPTYE